MMDEHWDTHQDAYLNHLAEKHGIPILALHLPLHRGAWGLDPGGTLVRVAKLVGRIGDPVVVVHPPPRGGRSRAGPRDHSRRHGRRAYPWPSRTCPKTWRSESST
jgi:hypothetical protein